MHTSPALFEVPPAARSGPPSISSGGTSLRASRVQYVMPWNSVRHVGHTRADDVASARPPPPPPPRAICGRGRGRGGGVVAGGGAGARTARSWSVVSSTALLRRRTRNAIATKPTITRIDRPKTATSIGSAVAKVLISKPIRDIKNPSFFEG